MEHSCATSPLAVDASGEVFLRDGDRVLDSAGHPTLLPEESRPDRPVHHGRSDWAGSDRLRTHLRIVPAGAVRLALDQNFPTPLINAVRDYSPTESTLEHAHRISKRLSGLDEGTLFLAQHHLEWEGLLTNITRCSMFHSNSRRSFGLRRLWSRSRAPVRSFPARTPDL